MTAATQPLTPADDSRPTGPPRQPPATSAPTGRSSRAAHLFGGLARISLGWVFLWAFLDKMFGLGYATESTDAWINGGSPTFGFLSFGAAGPFKGTYNSIAGATWADWLFMLGLLAIGVALMLGVAHAPRGGQPAPCCSCSCGPPSSPRRTTRSWTTTSSTPSRSACWRASVQAAGSGSATGGRRPAGCAVCLPCAEPARVLAPKPGTRVSPRAGWVDEASDVAAAETSPAQARAFVSWWSRQHDRPSSSTTSCSS